MLKRSFFILYLLIIVSTSQPLLDKHILPVYGNASLGYYYVNLYIGSPPQKQSVIIDTGSGQLALPCSECKSCGTSHLEKPLDIRRSSTNKIVTCVHFQFFRTQKMIFAKRVAAKMVQILAHLVYPMLKEARFLEYLFKMRFSLNLIEKMSQSPWLSVALSDKQTSFTPKRQMVFLVLHHKEGLNFSSNFIKNIINIQENNFFFQFA